MKFKKMKEEIATISCLPEEIVEEILLWLPRRSLMRFKCVSKSLCTLIDNPSFQDMHHELSNIKNNTSVLFCEVKRNKLYTINYKSVSSLFPLSTSSSKTNCQFINQMKFPSIFQDRQVGFLASCNGLVWVSLTRTEEEYYIWNPSTKAYKNITMVGREVNKSDICGLGFGYDYKSDDYKLVMLVANPASKCLDAHVYSLRSNSWKNTQSIPCCYLYGKGYPGVFLNGALHWLAGTSLQDFSLQDSMVLVCFNIVHERFVDVPLPEAPYIEEPLEGDMSDINVRVFGGRLCLVLHDFNVSVDVWTMQKYGVKESWTKSFSITEKSITSRKYLELIWSFKNEEVLWEINRGLILYQPENKVYKELVLDSDVAERLAITHNYMVSSVSL